MFARHHSAPAPKIVPATDDELMEPGLRLLGGPAVPWRARSPRGEELALESAFLRWLLDERSPSLLLTGPARERTAALDRLRYLAARRRQLHGGPILLGQTLLPTREHAAQLAAEIVPVVELAGAPSLPTVSVLRQRRFLVVAEPGQVGAEPPGLEHLRLLPISPADAEEWFVEQHPPDSRGLVREAVLANADLAALARDPCCLPSLLDESRCALDARVDLDLRNRVLQVIHAHVETALALCFTWRDPRGQPVFAADADIVARLEDAALQWTGGRTLPDYDALFAYHGDGRRELLRRWFDRGDGEPCGEVWACLAARATARDLALGREQPASGATVSRDHLDLVASSAAATHTAHPAGWSPPSP